MKIYLEAKFYRVVFFVFFAILGYEIINPESVSNVIFGYIKGIDNGFTSSFLAFYLFIPFLNALIEKLGKDIWKLIALLLGMFVIPSTFFSNEAVFHHVFWYMTIYLVAAWVRLYAPEWMNSVKITGVMMVATILLSIGSVLVNDYIGYRSDAAKHWSACYFMVNDSNKLFAFITGVSIFLFFKNLKMKNSRVINGIASTTFGVFLIHANGEAMRKWLWRDLLNVTQMYKWPAIKLVGTSVLIVIGIFAVCSVIDFIRIQLLEKPLFKLFDRKNDKKS